MTHTLPFRRLPLALLPLVAAAVAACGGTPTTPAATTASLTSIRAAVACASLAGMGIPIADIGLPSGGASVLAAVPVTDTDSAGSARDYCKVTGNIHPLDPAAAPIRFEVNLPASWNQRALQMGAAARMAPW